ncbi:MAG: hypothetical protein AAGN35_18850 [Bacteroidota bacterium]
MSTTDTDHFQMLKQAVEKRFWERYPGAAFPIREWKGQQIVDFQEDLMETVQGRISEKWFYTHIKVERNEKLPRIDMLNLLSRYAGFCDWRAFLHATAAVTEEEVHAEVPLPQVRSGRSWGRRVAMLVALVVLGSSLALVVASHRRPSQVTFCFVDADSGESLPDAGLSLKLLPEGESPRYIEGAQGGCLSLETDAPVIRLVVEAPYFQSDTILRNLNGEDLREEIPLKVDDYALMIHLFSTSKIEDWQRRRQQLDQMIADDAEIFQLEPGKVRGMEMYNKAEFINKMTMPVKSLRNVEVIETVYDREGKISGMRFVQKEETTQ